MTTKQADRIIKAGNVVAVRDKQFGTCFTALFIRRDRYNIYTQDGGIFDRASLELV